MQKTTKREYGIDLLRIISMMMVTMMHVNGHGGIINAATPFSAQYEFAWLLEDFFLVSINCFVMITGYVYFDKEIKYYHLFTLWAEVLFYSLFILIGLKFLFPEDIGLINLWKAVIPTFYTDNNFSRYWFFTSYVGMFILSPFVSLGLKHFNKKQDITVFTGMFIIFSFLPTVLGQEYAFCLNQGYSTLWFIVLYYTGGLIRKYNIFEKLTTHKWLLIYFICAILAWMIRYFLEKQGVIEAIFALNSFDCYSSSLYLIGGIAMLCAFIRVKVTNPAVMAVISFFSPVCFGVYLIHDNMALSYYFISGKFAFLAQKNPVIMCIGIVASGLGIFVICSLVDWIRELLFRKLKVEEKLAGLEQRFS
ncbi:acyltransferase [Butyrivibrio sp. JL13D10]|uniref:acyltransferase n=1 Tax=Butyrivibrio sp. JL13D10 TaxID=3236815 RepID=UPI0038B5EBE8